MTDIEFDQIRVGQTVRLHTMHRLTVEGEVSECALEHGRIKVGTPRFAVIRSVDVTRVELLSEPTAPRWGVGQLAEIDWATDEGAAVTDVAAWTDSPYAGWDVLTGGHVAAGLVATFRLLKPVPADAVVLPKRTGLGDPWDAERVRASAVLVHARGQFDASSYLHTLADAIEEAQR